MPRKPRRVWEPKNEEYRRVQQEQNPWHESGRVPSALAQRVERPLGPNLWRRLLSDEPRRFQLVLGPRRVGKTTCLYQTVRHLLDTGVDPMRIWWLRLDHPLLMEIPLNALVQVIVDTTEARFDQPVFLFLDELTYAADWDLWLKTFYDERWPIRLAGSSSATAAMKRRHLESGVGRWEEQYLAPYLFPEYLTLIDRGVEVPVRPTLSETIEACLSARINVAPLADARRRFVLTGGFPELLAGVDQSELDDESALLQSQRTLRSDAVERAIYKDIPQAFGIDNPMLLERVLYTLAGQVTGIMSPSRICASLEGITQPTFDRYVSYLVRAFLVFTLPNYSGSEASRQRRGRKLYFVDSAVRNAALQRGIGPLHDPVEMGALLENLVAGHLHTLSQRSQVRLYHWRDGQHEVDLIYDHPTAPLAFEVASSPSHSRAGLRASAERFSRLERGCFLSAPTAVAARPEENTSGVGSIPLDLLLLAIGAQAELQLRDALAAPGVRDSV